MTEPDELPSRMRVDLVAAMKGRDRTAVAALRTALAAFDDAEAVAAPPAPGPAATGEHFAGATAGLGSSEVARRQLSPGDRHEILRAQIDERNAEAGRYDELGRPDDADRLRREADVLARYLPD